MGNGDPACFVESRLRKGCKQLQSREAHRYAGRLSCGSWGQRMSAEQLHGVDGT